MRANHVYRPPPQYNRPQIYRQRPYEPYTLRWLFNRATQQYVLLTSIDALSHLFGTVATAGDVEVVPLLTDQGKTLTISSSGFITVNYGGPERQLITRDLYDASIGAFDATIPGTLVINNHAPIPVTAPLFPDGVAYEKDVAITPVDYGSLVTDEDGDTPAVSFLTSGPTGLGFVSDALDGTPTAYQNTGNIVRWTDAYGDYYEESINYLIGEVAPDVVTETESDAITELEALASFTVLQPSPTGPHPTIPVGSVISQVPAAGAIVAFDTEFELTLSVANASIQEVFIDELGEVRANLTGITVLIWRADFPEGAPDVELTDQTTDENGLTDWLFSYADLVEDSFVFYLAYSGLPPTSQTAGRVQPVFNS